MQDDAVAIPFAVRERMEHIDSMAVNSIPRILSIAGTDPTGGAGIQADLKSIGANGGYGMAVVTSLVAQNTRGVRSVHTPPTEFLREQLAAVSDDVIIDAVKIGMLGRRETIDVVARWLQQIQPPVVVLDPVMVATSGDRLLDPDAEEALRHLVGRVDLVTPNLAELGVLLDEEPPVDWEAALEAGRRLSGRHGVAVLVKGGHLDGGSCPDAVVDAAAADGRQVVQVPGGRIPTRNTHGTGCSLSAALATLRPQTDTWAGAVTVAKEWLTIALEQADTLGVGEGNGPVHHFHGYGRTDPSAFSRQLWQDIDDVRASIFALDFVRELADGSLPAADFGYYLAQDAVYLNGYAETLRLIGTMAPAASERLFWMEAAANCLDVESELHRSWLGGEPAEALPGPVTESYLNHLRAATGTGDYGVAVAAAVPCFWLYAHVGAVLHGRYRATEAAAEHEHPYGRWLQTYDDQEFQAAAGRAVRIMDFAAHTAEEPIMDKMSSAFIRSAELELDFFDAARLHAGTLSRTPQA